MVVSLINHGTTERAKQAVRTFKQHIDELISCLIHHSTSLSTSWQGISYSYFLEVVALIQQELQATIIQIARSSSHLGVGHDLAIQAEREAIRREEEARTQAALLAE